MVVGGPKERGVEEVGGTLSGVGVVAAGGDPGLRAPHVACFGPSTPGSAPRRAGLGGSDVGGGKLSGVVVVGRGRCGSGAIDDEEASVCTTVWDTEESVSLGSTSMGFLDILLATPFELLPTLFKRVLGSIIMTSSLPGRGEGNGVGTT